MQNRDFTQNYIRSPYSHIISPSINGPWECNVCYPEVYYRIQPIVMSACDMMDADDIVVSSQEMFDRISDDIYADVSRMHPELVEYAGCHDMGFGVESQQRDFPLFRFRRKGIFRDFIDLLILNELLRRGRVTY